MNLVTTTRCCAGSTRTEKPEAMPGELLYRIVDEPVQTRVSRLAVRPLWPWLALALGGAWAGVPWFAVNAFALGSKEALRLEQTHREQRVTQRVLRVGPEQLTQVVNGGRPQLQRDRAPRQLEAGAVTFLSFDLETFAHMAASARETVTDSRAASTDVRRNVEASIKYNPFRISPPKCSCN